MTLRSAGGIAALICAGTYIFGFVLLVTLLSSLGFGTGDADEAAIIEFVQSNQGILILWNTMIYIVNALALAVLVVSLAARLKDATPELAAVTQVFGIIWATLVLGAGMIANIAVEHAANIAATDVDRAIALWETLHAVESGLGGGNEIAGGVWIACVSWAGWQGRSLGRVAIGLGLLTGLGGFATIIPPLGETPGAIFGLGAIAWFVVIGINLLRKPTMAAA